MATTPKESGRREATLRRDAPRQRRRAGAGDAVRRGAAQLQVAVPHHVAALPQRLSAQRHLQAPFSLLLFEFYRSTSLDHLVDFLDSTLRVVSSVTLGFFLVFKRLFLHLHLLDLGGFSSLWII